jgi:hypothetical protein
MIRCASSPWRRAPWACAGLLAASVFLAGCGGCGSSLRTEPGPLKDRDAIVAALPRGVALDSPIVPSPMLGPNSKTVEEALTSLQAYVRDGKILDGGLGHEIRFETGSGGSKPATEATKPGKTKGAPTTVIKLKT